MEWIELFVHSSDTCNFSLVLQFLLKEHMYCIYNFMKLAVLQMINVNVVYILLESMTFASNLGAVLKINVWHYILPCFKELVDAFSVTLFLFLF